MLSHKKSSKLVKMINSNVEKTIDTTYFHHLCHINAQHKSIISLLERGNAKCTHAKYNIQALRIFKKVWWVLVSHSSHKGINIPPPETGGSRKMRNSGSFPSWHQCFEYTLVPWNYWLGNKILLQLTPLVLFRMYFWYISTLYHL